MSKKYLKTMAVGFDNPKVTVFVQDGVEYMRQEENKYDVIITDSSDPEGPAEVLYEQNYFQLVHRALRPGGIMCLQGNFQSSEISCLILRISEWNRWKKGGRGWGSNSSNGYFGLGSWAQTSHVKFCNGNI